MKRLFSFLLLACGLHALAQTDRLPNAAISVQQQGYIVNPADTLLRQAWVYYGNKKADRMVRYPELLRWITTIQTLYVGLDRQFPTIQAAIDAAPATGANIIVDNGTYPGFTIPAGKKNIVIKGASRALFDKQTQGWTTGVLVTGTCFIYGSYTTIDNMGFSVVSGVGTGLTINTLNGHVNVLNCDFAGYDYYSSEHNVLVDGGDNDSFLNCNFYNGFHGLAVKVSHFLADHCYYYGHAQDNIIVRADDDASTVGYHPVISDVKLTNSTIEVPAALSSQSYGIILDSQAGPSTLLYGVMLSNVSIKGALIGIATAGALSTIDSKPYRIRGVQISGAQIDGCSAGINLFGANGVSISGYVSSNNKFSLQNFNSLHVFMDATGTSYQDSVKYKGAIEGFYTDTAARGAYGTAAPQSRFQFFNSDSRGDTLTLYAGQRGDGAGASLDFRMSTPDGVPNSVIARLRANAFTGGSNNGFGLWIGDWNSHNAADLKTYWNQTGLLDHYGTIRIRGGNPQSARILQSIDNTGLSQWVDFSSYLTNENLQSVTNRGAITTNNITISNPNQDADRYINIKAAGVGRKAGIEINDNMELYHLTGGNVGDLYISPLSGKLNILGNTYAYNLFNLRTDLTAAPTATTPGAKGDFYIDANNGYIWTGINTVKSFPFSDTFGGAASGSGTTSFKHLAGTTGTPTIAAGSGAGTGATVSIRGTDAAGEITITTGTSLTSGAALATITFNASYTASPFVVLQRSSSTAPTDMFLNLSTTTTFGIAGTLAASTTYKWNYIIVQ